MKINQFTPIRSDEVSKYISLVLLFSISRKECHPCPKWIRPASKKKDQMILCISISMAGTEDNALKYIGAIPHMVYAIMAKMTP
ncbi:hypothetical protein VcTj87_06260 [Vibrio comitans]